MRKAHVLKPNHSSSYPSRVIFFDTETVREEIEPGRERQVFKLGWACFWRRRREREKDTVEWYEIKVLEDFWDWVIQHSHEGTRLYLVAHNIDFDLGVTAGYKAILDRGFKLHKHWERGTSKFYCWKFGRRTIVALDNTNFFQGTLEKLGKSLGFPKLQVDFETVSDEELSIYCKRDVEIMLRAWQRWINFCQENDLGVFGNTLAGQSFNAYRHRFMPVKIYIHDNQEVIDLERECYKGGRCECFYIGCPPGGPFYYLDVNSMYPHVMRENYYPTRLAGYYRNPSVKYFLSTLENYCVCAHVRVQSEVAAFPVRYKQRTFHPVGEFDCFLSTPEIIYLLENGKLLRVYAFARYEKAMIFREFVDYFYAERLKAKAEGDETLSYFFKIMMNSLYGKFGQKSVRWEKIGECSPDLERVEQVVDLKTGKKYSIRYHNGIVEQTTEEEEAYNSFPAIAAHVTAYSRIYLQRLIDRAGKENVFYVDTDSLIVNEIGYQNLTAYLDNSKLGCLKLEEVGEFFEIRGPKDYTFGKKTKVKGIRFGAQEVAPGVYEQDKWLGFASRIRTGELNTFIVEKQRKALQRVYLKGKLLGGGAVSPWRLPEDQEEIFRVL